MLELGQPRTPTTRRTSPSGTLRARRARPGETIVTLDGVEATGGGRSRIRRHRRRLVIVTGTTRSSGSPASWAARRAKSSDATTDVLLEAAYFDPMSIARRLQTTRTSQRSVESLRTRRRSQLGLRAAARFVQILHESCPELECWAVRSTFTARRRRRRRSGCPRRYRARARRHDRRRRGGLDPSGLRFDVSLSDGDSRSPRPRRDPTCEVVWRAGPTSSRRSLDSTVIVAAPSRADVARTGGLSNRQKLRRHVRDVVVDLGAVECWTPTLGSDGDFDLLSPVWRECGSRILSRPTSRYFARR